MSRMRHIVFGAFAVFASAAQAGFGGMADVGESDAGPVDTSALPAMLIGAVVGYFLERAYRKRELDKRGANYTSEYLGGKVGAIVGALALPILIGLLR